MTSYVIARCVECGTERRVEAGEVQRDEMPDCEKKGCFGFCVAVAAKGKP